MEISDQCAEMLLYLDFSLSCSFGFLMIGWVSYLAYVNLLGKKSFDFIVIAKL
jgi:hypothetical protein